MSDRPQPKSRDSIDQEQFLTILSREDALARFEAALFPRPVPSEMRPLADALGAGCNTPLGAYAVDLHEDEGRAGDEGEEAAEDKAVDQHGADAAAVGKEQARIKKEASQRQRLRIRRAERFAEAEPGGERKRKAEAAECEEDRAPAEEIKQHAAEAGRHQRGQREDDGDVREHLRRAYAAEVIAHHGAPEDRTDAAAVCQ